MAEIDIFRGDKRIACNSMDKQDPDENACFTATDTVLRHS